MAHLEEPIEVATLAAIAGRSSFHFTRIFARTVGVTPHRYIVHLRLQCAIELIRDRQHGLAELHFALVFLTKVTLHAGCSVFMVHPLPNW